MGCILSCFKNTNNDKKEFKSYPECAICLESLDETSEALYCAHVFHENCLKTWRNSKQLLRDKCPLCLN